MIESCDYCQPVEGEHVMACPAHPGSFYSLAAAGAFRRRPPVHIHVSAGRIAAAVLDEARLLAHETIGTGARATLAALALGYLAGAAARRLRRP